MLLIGLEELSHEDAGISDSHYEPVWRYTWHQQLQLWTPCSDSLAPTDKFWKQAARTLHFTFCLLYVGGLELFIRKQGSDPYKDIRNKSAQHFGTMLVKIPKWFVRVNIHFMHCEIPDLENSCYSLVLYYPLVWAEQCNIILYIIWIIILLNYILFWLVKSRDERFG